MSKELEALNKIENHVNCYKKDKEDYKEHFEILNKALTPPIAEKVCEALTDFIGFNVNFERFDGDFYYTDHNFNLCYLVEKPTFDNGKREKVIIHEPLPPHLITLIGRFYESVVSL